MWTFSHHHKNNHKKVESLYWYFLRRYRLLADLASNRMSCNWRLVSLDWHLLWTCQAIVSVNDIAYPFRGVPVSRQTGCLQLVCMVLLNGTIWKRFLISVTKTWWYTKICILYLLYVSTKDYLYCLNDPNTTATDYYSASHILCDKTIAMYSYILISICMYFKGPSIRTQLPRIPVTASSYNATASGQFRRPCHVQMSYPAIK